MKTSKPLEDSEVHEGPFSRDPKQPTQGEVTPLPETHPCQGTPMWVGKDKAGKRNAASHSETGSPPHPRRKPQSDPPVTFCGF